MDKYFEIGQIVNTNGLKGIVKVKPFTDNIKEFEAFESIYVQKKAELIEFKIESVRYSKNMVLLKLKGIDDIDAAEALRNLYIKVRREQLPKLQENSYYIVDLLECEVVTVDGEILGKMDDVFNTGSNDVYVVKNEEGKQILLPAIKEVIKNVDIPNRKITVKLMEGLI
ncbi:MAG: ribosome maturation factor RimM [Clostridia bacterium]